MIWMVVSIHVPCAIENVIMRIIQIRIISTRAKWSSIKWQLSLMQKRSSPLFLLVREYLKMHYTKLKKIVNLKLGEKQNKLQHLDFQGYFILRANSRQQIKNDRNLEWWNLNQKIIYLKSMNFLSNYSIAQLIAFSCKLTLDPQIIIEIQLSSAINRNSINQVRKKCKC
ncbi:unnamed protein product [Paramecium octaurelia]|uniref:Uncharacterized protein n=1 Tax=Paramecium octaurelia TaxID=43137 RepID=A0A8S1WFM9_PAROT|nr:unnamed protein product [Paramecium octaurelia]